MYIFAEPMTEKEADDIQRRNKRKNEKLTKQLLGLSEHESEEDDIDQDEDDAAAWSKLRNKVDQQISGQEADESRSRGVIDAEENDDELSFERRLLRMQISAEELNKRVERAKNAAAAEEHRRAAEGSGSDDWGLSELPGEAGVRPSEAEFVAVSSSLYQLERRVAGIAGEIEAEQGDNSKLLFYVNHTRNLIKAQVEHIAEHASHLVVNVEGSDLPRCEHV